MGLADHDPRNADCFLNQTGRDDHANCTCRPAEAVTWVVGNLQTGEVHEETTMVRPVTPEEFMRSLDRPPFTAGGLLPADLLDNETAQAFRAIGSRHRRRP